MATTRLVAEPLDLESGGRVTFNDPADILARDYRQLRRMSASVNTDDGMDMDELYNTMNYFAKIMIAEWRIPYFAPNHPLPKDAPDLLDELKVIDRKQLEIHLLPVLSMYIWRWEGGITSGKEGEVPNPTAPAGEQS